jgi:hypothetical protein
VKHVGITARGEETVFSRRRGGGGAF